MILAEDLTTPEPHIVNYCYGCNHIFIAYSYGFELCPWCGGSSFKMHRCQAEELQIAAAGGKP